MQRNYLPLSIKASKVLSDSMRTLENSRAKALASDYREDKGAVVVGNLTSGFAGGDSRLGSGSINVVYPRCAGISYFFRKKSKNTFPINGVKAILYTCKNMSNFCFIFMRIPPTVPTWQMPAVCRHALVFIELHL